MMRYINIGFWVLWFLGVEQYRCEGSRDDGGGSMSSLQMLHKAQPLLESHKTRHKLWEGAGVVTERAFDDALWWLSRSMLMEPDNFDAQTMAIDMLLSILDEKVQMKKARQIVETLAVASTIPLAAALAGNMATLSSEFNQNREELLTLAYNLDPSNLAIRALSHHYERAGDLAKASAILSQALEQNSNQAWLHIAAATHCPYTVKSDLEAFELASSIPKRLRTAARTIWSLGLQSDDPHEDLGLTYHPAIPWQYLGYNMRPFMEEYARAVYSMSPRLANEPSPLVRTERKLGCKKQGKGFSEKMRIGVLLERLNVHSPSAVFADVLRCLDRDRFEVVVLAEETSYIKNGQKLLEAADEVVWLENRPGYKGVLDEMGTVKSTGFSRRVLNNSGMPTLWGSMKRIAEAKLDALIIMATANVLVSQLFSLSRLAPVQILFGLGHPITSGSQSIDYFIGSELFETPASFSGRERRRVKRENAARGNDVWNEENDVDAKIGDGNQDYAEQLALFETFSGSFSSITEQQIPSNEEVLSVLRDELGLENFEEMHIYNCMQYVGKLRHDFDEALKGILVADPKVRILMLKESTVLLQRWETTIGTELLTRVLFVPKLPVREAFALYKASSVLLAPFGWSTGITSFEFLGLCIPVVTLPSTQSVLQFTRAQLLQIGVLELCASSVKNYVEIAVRLATDMSYADATRQRIFNARSQLFDQEQAVANECSDFLQRAICMNMP